jgi:hypothetical protein
VTTIADRAAMKSVAERDLATVRDWKLIGIALATAAGAVEAKLLAENPHLAFRAALTPSSGPPNTGGVE